MITYWQSLEQQPVSLTMAVAGGVLFAWQAVARERNKAWSPLATLGILCLIGFAGAYRWVFGSDTIWATARDCSTDLAIGALAGVLVLLFRRGALSALLGPAIVLVLAAGGMHLLEGLGTWASNALSGTNDPYSIATGETEFVLEMGPDDDISELADHLNRNEAVAARMFPDLTVTDDPDLAQVFLIRCPEGNATALRNALTLDTENVDALELNASIRLAPPDDNNNIVQQNLSAAGPSAPNDPNIREQFWLNNAESNTLFQGLRNLRPRRKAIVAIIDTGIDGQHTDLNGAVDPNSPSLSDRHGHGTHCAGLAGAVANNGQDIASLNWEGRFIQVRSFSALNDNGFGTNESVAQAIVAAARGGADVLSLSLGTNADEPVGLHARAIQYALRKGCIVVCAAGNDAADARRHSPSNVPGVIVVSAVDASNQRAPFSNTNNGLAMPISAPGVGILSLKNGGGTTLMSGTSMATPIVAGVLGVMRAIEPTISARAAYERLRSTGIDGPDVRVVGRTVSPLRALRIAQ